MDYPHGVWNPIDAILERSFVGRHWRDLSAEYLFANQEIFFYLKPEAFRFYLPAWLLAVVQGGRFAGDLIMSVLTIFTPEDPAGSMRDLRYRARMASLSAKEKGAVTRFLRWVRDASEEDTMEMELAECALAKLKRFRA